MASFCIFKFQQKTIAQIGGYIFQGFFVFDCSRRRNVIPLLSSVDCHPPFFSLLLHGSTPIVSISRHIGGVLFLQIAGNGYHQISLPEIKMLLPLLFTNILEENMGVKILRYSKYIAKMN